MAEQRWETPQPLGLVAVRQEVLTSIAARAMEGVEGVRPLRGGGGIIGILSGGEDAVQITVRGDRVDVELRIAVVLGYSVHSVARAVQRRVREELEGVVGATVGRVDVDVRHVIPPAEVLMLDERGEDAEG
ncbi:Asp23/Gls24 family envelope stress response protein [Candidatus Bipolaricaulota bacterium]|nr:Asp23/Gls24 family envelope stress response protein [Candidatus Bipolaricaulota bacterium]